MTTTMRVGAVQLPARVGGRSFKEKQERNLQTILEMLRCAGERRPDLVLFGEYANLHHRTWSDDKKEYVPDPIPGRFTRLVAAEARKHEMNIAMPMFGVYEGILSSHVVLFDRSGKIIGTYQKAHPTIAEQEIGIRCGDRLPVFELDCARIGVMTCMDIEYPEVAQALMLRGADLLLFPHVQGSWGELDWEVRYRARAIDTGLHVVSACFGYPEGEWMPGKMIGRTSVVGRDGLILADLGRGIGVLMHDIDLRQKRVTEFFFKTKHDRTLAVAASRRPELYHDLVDEQIKASALGRVKSEESQMKRGGRNKKEGGQGRDG